MMKKIAGSVIAAVVLFSPIVTASPAAAQVSVSDGAKIIKKGKQYIGDPYRWGGTTVKGFDCSGLTQHIFHVLGKSIPRTADSQYRHSHHDKTPKPGDLVFVHDGRGHVYHVGVYVNSHTWLESERPGKGVNLYKPWSKRVYYGHYNL
jgi:cell wall-associated NlpC family hydrolase